jgi:hypothetical protein
VEYLRLPSLAAYLVLSQDEVKAWAYIKGSEDHPGPQMIAGTSASINVPALGIDLPLAEIYGVARNVAWKARPDEKILSAEMKIR